MLSHSFTYLKSVNPMEWKEIFQVIGSLSRRSGMNTLRKSNAVLEKCGTFVFCVGFLNGVSNCGIIPCEIGWSLIS